MKHSTDFLKNRHHTSGYGVTFHTSGWLGESTFQHKQAALEAAQEHCLNRGGRATVFPRKGRTMILNSKKVGSVYYWLDKSGLQFLTSLP